MATVELVTTAPRDKRRRLRQHLAIGAARRREFGEYFMARAGIDALTCRQARLQDLDESEIQIFIKEVERMRGKSCGAPLDFLTEIGLVRRGKPTYAAVLLFATSPERFGLCSQVVVREFAATSADGPPLRETRFSGPLSQTLNAAFRFVIDLVDGPLGSADASAPHVAPWIEMDAWTEIMLLAEAHRDITLAEPISISVFRDRLEVWAPIPAASGLLDRLAARSQQSVARNRKVAEALALRGLLRDCRAGTIEAANFMQKVGLPPPEVRIGDGVFFILRGEPSNETALKPESLHGMQPETLSTRLLRLLLAAELTKDGMRRALNQDSISGHLNKVVRALLAAGHIAQTIPGRPNSRLQSYKITSAGRSWLVADEARM